MTSSLRVGQIELGDTADDVARTSFIAKQLINRMATATLVLVKAVTADKVDVQPMVAQIDGAGNAIPHGTIHALPWFALRSGAAAFVAPPQVGDIGLAVFCHSDTSAVKKTKKPAPPGSRRRFDWADGIYLGGLLGPTPTSYVRLEPDGSVTIQAATGKNVACSGPLVISGEVRADDLYVSGHKVVGAQQPGLPVNATDLASAIALVNALKAGLMAHGLFA